MQGFGLVTFQVCRLDAMETDDTRLSEQFDDLVEQIFQGWATVSKCIPVPFQWCTVMGMAISLTDEWIELFDGLFKSPYRPTILARSFQLPR